MPGIPSSGTCVCSERRGYAQGWICPHSGHLYRPPLSPWTWDLEGKPPVLISSGGHRSERYASYLNAF